MIEYKSLNCNRNLKA